MWGFAGGHHHHGMPQRFEEQYHCNSVAFADRGHLEVREREQSDWTKSFTIEIITRMMLLKRILTPFACLLVPKMQLERR